MQIIIVLRFALIAGVIWGGALLSLAQTPPCPPQTGAYAIVGNEWHEMHLARATSEKLRAAFPFHDKMTAVYAGVSAALALGNDPILCASGVGIGGEFALAKATVNKHDRRVGIGTEAVGTFALNFEIDKKQAIAVLQSRGNDGSYTVHATHLAAGEYVLYLKQGTSFASGLVAFDFSVAAPATPKL